MATPTQLIEIPDLDDDDDQPSPLGQFAPLASSTHTRSGSFAGSGLPNLPPLRNPFAPDGISSPVEARSRSGSSSQHAGTPASFRRGHYPRSSSSGGSYANSLGSTGVTSSPVTALPPLPPHKPSNQISGADAASELALGHVLESFIESAEQKIADALNKSLDQEVYFPSLLAEGVDPTFDALIGSIGHISKRLPKLVIDMIMRWRKSHNEGFDVSGSQRSVHSTTSPTALFGKSAIESTAERRSFASIYILCRVLTVVVTSVDRQILGEELGAKLEDILFNSLKNADPLQVQRSANRRANMDLYARLIGSMSAIRFVSVSDRFIAELDHINRGFVAKETEAKVEHMIYGMRYLKLQVYPQEAFEETAEFAESLANIFEAASGFRIKTALAATIARLLDQVVRGANAEVHHPLWAKAMQTIHARASAMVTKPRYLTAALPLICATVAGSPVESLLANWNGAVDLCFNKMKDKTIRPFSLVGVVQMLWAYLRRGQESHSSVAKRLDPLFKAFFPPGRRSIYPSECPPDLAACILHYILCRHFELGTEMMTYLIGSSASSEHPGLEGLAPERLTVAFRAIMRTLDSLEKNTEPALPSNVDQEDTSFVEMNDVAAGPLPESMFARIGLKALLEAVTGAIARAAVVCERNLLNATVLDDSNVTTMGASAYNGDRDLFITRRHGAFTVTYARERQAFFDLQRACYDSWPRCLRAEAVDFRPVEMLLRGLVHVDLDVCISARGALERLTRLSGGAEVVRTACQFVSRPEFVHRDAAALQIGTNITLEWLTDTCLALIRIWIGQIIAATNRAVAADIPIHPSRRPGTSEAVRDPALQDIDPNESWSLVPCIEATALVLLCACTGALRRRAFDLMHGAMQLEQQLMEWTTSRGLPTSPNAGKRIWRILESAAPLLNSVVDEDRVPSQERSRLHRWRKMPDALFRIIESEDAFDFSLWKMLLGPVFAHVLNESQQAADMARPLLIARVLRLYLTVSAVAGLASSRNPPITPGRNIMGASTAIMTQETAHLIDHWRAHLTALFATTISTTSEKADRENLQLSSGADLIRLVIPLLATEQAGLRDAVVAALGNINIGLYRCLLDNLHPIVGHLSEERKVRQAQSQSARRSKRFDRLHTSVAQTYELTSHLLEPPDNILNSNEAVLGPLLFFVRENLMFFRDTETHDDAIIVAVRRSYCNTARAVVEFCTKTKTVERWFPADLMCDLFALFDIWSFRPLGPISPEAFRGGPKSFESGSHHTNKSRGSSLGSAAATFEVYVPATSAIVALCESKAIPLRKDLGDKANPQLEPQDVLRWTQALFEQINPAGHASARRALFGLISANPAHKHLLDATTYQCFAEPDTLHLQQSTWSVFSDAILGVSDLALKQSSLFCLALWKMGHPDLQTRQRAVDVLASHLPVDEQAALMRRCESALYSSFPGAALQARRELALSLASTHSAEARGVFLELTIRILQIGNKQTRMLLQLLPPWIANLSLPVADRSKTTDPVLANLFLLSAKYGDIYYIEIRELWDALSSGANGANFRILLRFLIDETIRRGSKDFTRHAQRVIGCLCECDRAAFLSQELADLVQPADMAGTNDFESTPLAGSTSSGPRRTNLDTLFPTHNRKLAASTAQAALLLVGDALVCRLSTADPCIPRLLHGYLVAIDHSIPFVRTHARDSMLRCLTLLEKLPHVDGKVAEQAHMQSLDAMSENRTWRSFWEHDDNGVLSVESEHTPRQMRGLIEDACCLLEGRIPDIRRLWGAVALEWATSCPIRHIACRSFQAFRLLNPTVSQRMLADMLARLSSTIADESPDNQLFAREISWTLSGILQKADKVTLTDLPQAFWASAVCLGTTLETEFLEAAKCLDSALSIMGEKLDKSLATALETCRPSCFATPSAQLIRTIAHKGIRSSATCATSFALLRHLTSSTYAGMIASLEDSLPLLYGTAMLYGLNALEAGKVDADTASFAMRLAELGDKFSKNNITRIMTSLAKNRFRTKDDFVRQATGNLTEYFTPLERVDVMLLFLSALCNPTAWLRLRSLVLLKAFAKHSCLTEADAEQLPPDALKPLLNLMVQGEFATLALGVMDEALPGARRLLSGPSRQGVIVLKRGRDASIPEGIDRIVFGESSTTGWSAPTNKTIRQGVRHRLREVVDSCSGAPLGSSSRSGSPIAFAIDDFDASATLDIHGPDFASQSEAGDASTLGDMVDALHDLGSFFDDGASTHSNASVAPMNGFTTPDRSGIVEVASAAPSYRMSQALGSASRVAAVLARSLRSGSPSHSSSAVSGHAVPRMETIAESSLTPFNAAFAEPGSQTTPRIGAPLASMPLQRYNSDGVYSTASSSAAGSGSPDHRRNGTHDTLSSDSESESAWGDGSAPQTSASSHENVRIPAGLAFTSWDTSTIASDGEGDSENLFDSETYASPGHRRRRSPFLRMKKSPSPHRMAVSQSLNG